MPTTRPRHTITETEPVARALEIARSQWPGETDAQLLRRLALSGAEALERGVEDQRELRRAVVREHAGAGAGSFEPGYLDRLREDWQR